MRTSKETAEQILTKLQLVAEARIRPMMGEYLVYINDKVAGQINHNDLYIKVTDFGLGFAPELVQESPYDGARPAFKVPASNIDDTEWLRDFVTGTIIQLPAPKKK